MKNKIDPIKQISDFDYSYCIEYNYDTDRDCAGYGCDSICRCSKIESVNIEDIVSNFISFFDSKDIFFNYCIDRIIRINYQVNTGRGYYGEELYSIRLYDNITTDIEKLTKIESNIDKIKFVLNLEYGHEIPFVTKAQNAEVIEIDLGKIKFPNDQYHHKVSKEDTYYENYKYPIGIFKKSGGFYQVIDGYHRTIAALKTNKQSKIIVIS